MRVQNERIPVTGYRHTGIIVKDMQRSVFFYRDILGLKVMQDFWDGSEYINRISGLEDASVHMVQLKAMDGTVIELLDYASHPTNLMPQPIHNVGACHVAFRVASAEEAYRRLTEAGVHPISEPVLSSEGIAKVFFCRDPNSVRIEFVEMVEMVVL